MKAVKVKPSAASSAATPVALPTTYYRDAYNGVKLTVKAGTHYPKDEPLNGLTDYNAQHLINEVMNLESHRLPLMMYIYELGNVFTATLHAASHKYTSFVAAATSKENRGYLESLIKETRLNLLVSVMDDGKPLDTNFRRYIKMLQQHDLNSLDGVAVIIPDRHGDILGQINKALNEVADYCDSIYVVASVNLRDMPTLDEFQLEHRGAYYRYWKDVQYQPSVLAQRTIVAREFYQRQVERNKRSYVEFLKYILEKLLAKTDLTKPENATMKQRVVQHYLSESSLQVFYQAITASDYSVERPADQRMNDYEVYEMLGDRVLESGLVHYLKERFPDITQEELTNLKIYFLSTTQQQRLALELGLTKYLISGFKTDLEDVFEDIFEAFTEALVVVGERLVPGLGAVMSSALINYIFDKIQIEPSDPKYKSAITRVKELYTQQHWRQPWFTFTDEGNAFTVVVKYNEQLKPPKSSLPVGFSVDVHERFITGLGRSKRELKEQAYQILWEMLEETGYKLDRELGKFPRELSGHFETFLTMMREARATDYRFRLTPAKGKSHGVSGALELLIDDVWKPMASAVAPDARECYQRLFQYFVALRSSR